MKVNQLREIQTLIYNIYYNGEDPKKFGEITGIENYLEELYPSDPKKLVGDWISKHYDINVFLNHEYINSYIKDFSDLFNKVRFYANIPNGKTLSTIIKELERNLAEVDSPGN